jgi:hypothetical protein
VIVEGISKEHDMGNRQGASKWVMVSLGLLGAIAALLLSLARFHWPVFRASSMLLTDPFLQNPTPTSVEVVWFTEFPGTAHWVDFGREFEQRAIASTRKLSRIREDQDSYVGQQNGKGERYSNPTPRDIWRHAATIPLEMGDRLPYRVTSQKDAGHATTSAAYTLAGSPLPGQPLKILLTSDHQNKPMTPANLQKVVETVGAVDAVFFAGDLVDVPDRASEWFDDNRGRAFFPSLQGNAHGTIDLPGNTKPYRGGAIVQTAPLFAAVGNHEVMGRWSVDASLKAQFNDPYPREAAQQRYREAYPDRQKPADEAWLADHAFNTISFDEILTKPESAQGRPYYAVTFGDIRLVVLYAAQIWRSPSLKPDVRGRYQEREADLDHPERWGFGQHIFEPITVGSPQYQWLEAELTSPDFQAAPFKIVMLHYPPHSVGANIVPAYTNPVQMLETNDEGNLQAIRYEYPLENEYLSRDVMPLLAQAGVQLVFYGHSHLWNRFVSPEGMHFLESSNVGNTYGAYVRSPRSGIPADLQEQQVKLGDPNGLPPVIPNLDPLLEGDDPLPYIASDHITVFSILDTATKSVRSYRFDLEHPDWEVHCFDEFSLSVVR